MKEPLLTRETAAEILALAKDELRTAAFHVVFIPIDEANTFMKCVDVQATLREVNRELNLGVFVGFMWMFGVYYFFFTDLFSI